VRRALVIVAALVPVVGVVTACQDDGPDGTRFCGRLAEEQPLLAGGVATVADVDAAVVRYRELEKMAPAAVREPWSQLTTLVEQAATADLSTDDGQRRVHQLAYESQGAATAVATWARDVCGIDLSAPPTAPPTTVGADPATSAPAPPST
jgi:hypothetical protein